MLFHDLVTTSLEVSQSAGRLDKIGLLARCMSGATPHEIPIVISYLSGSLRQGRIGIGLAKVWRLGVGPAAEPSLTLPEVDQVFSRIAETVGSGSAAARAEMLKALFARATEDEQHFLVRLIMGELRQGALEGVMVEAVAQAAAIPAQQIRRALMMTGDLSTVAEAAFAGGAAALEAFGVTLFKPIAPMLAQPAADVAEALARLGEAALEWKLDGARIQLHKEGEAVRIYSRNLNDVTGAVPDLVEVASRFRADSLILDGEAIALHPDGSPYPFQSTMRRFGRKLDVERQRKTLPLSSFFFDCMYLDGETLIDHPAAERLRRMEQVLPAEVLMPRLVTADLDAARRFVADVLARGHEGIMAKSLDAPYEAGRRGYAWLKVKPVQTLDLVVLAGEWGHGRRSGTLSNLHLGAADGQGGFVMLGKTFKGLTDAMLKWQTERLLELEVSRDQWTVYVRPELMVEIAFSDIQASPRYPGGFALRFARVKRYRPDKSPQEADTLETVRLLYRKQGGKGEVNGDADADAQLSLFAEETHPHPGPPLEGEGEE